MNKSLHEIFIQEAEENLVILENAIISIEQDPGDENTINEAFRAIHSIKGGAGLAGFSGIKDFTHLVEDLFEYIRSGELKVKPDHISLILESLDIIKLMIANIREEADSNQGIETAGTMEKIGQIIEALKKGTSMPGEGQNAPAAGKTRNLFYISLDFYPEIFATGIDPAMFISDLKKAGEILFIYTDRTGFPPEERFDPEKFYLKWQLFYSSEKTEKDLRDIFIFVADESQIQVVDLGAVAAQGQDPGEYRIQGRTIKDFESLAGSEVKAPGEAATQVPVEDDRRKFGRRSTDRKEPEAGASSFIRVQTEKLENIFNTVSELLISQARLSMLTEEYEDEINDNFSAVSDSLKNITGILQEQITSLRMMSLSSTFDRFKRVVRDIATERGKQVQFIVSGQETELDKNMIEKLNDPLKHLVRNCIDHGIETEEERIRKGKSPQGQLTISASIESGKVVLEVKDDGAGIDQEKLLSKARERGIIKEDQALTEGEILNLIFHPGLSTAEKITDLSGRGVGMDVVKSSINELHGDIELKSQKDEGTSFRLHLPLTLAILDGMLVSVGMEKYILPTLSILEIFRPQKEHLKTISGRGEVVFFRGEYIPLLRVHRVLGVEHAIEYAVDAELIVVFSGGNKAALLVDTVLEQFQIVLKSLQRNFRKVEHISSATILGKGDVALILDIQSILQSGVVTADVSKV